MCWSTKASTASSFSAPVKDTGCCLLLMPFFFCVSPESQASAFYNVTLTLLSAPDILQKVFKLLPDSDFSSVMVIDCLSPSLISTPLYRHLTATLIITHLYVIIGVEFTFF